jgi:TRAP-type C4-dicarboxylate transport system permease small subunit
MMPEESVFLPGLRPGGVFLGVLAALAAIGLLIHALLQSRLGAERLDHWTRRIEGALFTVLIAAMLLLSGLQVVLRNFFHGGLIWIDPVVRSLVLWVAFIGAMTATSQARHLHIDVLPRVLPPGLSRFVGRVLSVVSAVCCALLANGAFVYLRDEYAYGVSPFLGVPSWVVQSVLLWGFALLMYRFLVQAIWPFQRSRNP